MSERHSTPNHYHEAEQFRFPEDCFFTLESETGIDWRRIADEKAEAERVERLAAESAKDADERQQRLF